MSYGKFEFSTKIYGLSIDYYITKKKEIFLHTVHSTRWNSCLE